MVKCRCYKLYAPNVYEIRLLQFPENILRSGGSEKLVHVIKVAAGGGGERKAKYLWEEPSATLKFAAFSAEKRCFHTPQPTGGQKLKSLKIIWNILEIAVSEDFLLWILWSLNKSKSFVEFLWIKLNRADWNQIACGDPRKRKWWEWWLIKMIIERID